MSMACCLNPLLAVVLAPLLLGIINRTKAIFAGRRGQPLCQTYFDLAKLVRKGVVYSRTTTWVFRAAPLVGVTAVLAALCLVPFGGVASPVAFAGDLILLAYLLGLARFFTVAGALDTGSAFEGMGASREVQFASFAEPVLVVALAAVARKTGCLSLSPMFASVSPGAWAQAGPALALVSVALLVVFLVENSRIPIDDPNTHLELTMIHEVMVLDYSGPDFACIQYAAALKLWILGSLLVGILVPVRTGHVWLDVAAFLGGMFTLAVLTGVIESTMARLRLLSVPQLIVGAGALSLFALMLLR